MWIAHFKRCTIIELSNSQIFLKHFTISSSINCFLKTKNLEKKATNSCFMFRNYQFAVKSFKKLRQKEKKLTVVIWICHISITNFASFWILATESFVMIALTNGFFSFHQAFIKVLYPSWKYSKLFQFLIQTIATLIDISVYFYLLKQQAGQGPLLVT